MNADTIKTELQQVLDNDIALRKEFNELKRSLSDYRNQLIRRDEDCKRLQVTIDVLNTKLVVLERDNTSYKAELAAFTELRGTITEQLGAKQGEIDERIAEIQGLRDELTSMAADYEARIETMRQESAEKLDRVINEYSTQIEELKNDTRYKETGIKDEFENRLSFLSISWAEKEQSMLFNHEEELTRIRTEHAIEMETSRENYNSMLANISASSHEELASLRLAHQAVIDQMEEDFTQRYESLEQNVGSETASLKAALEEQRSTLTGNFNANIASLASEYSLKEESLRGEYEMRITELQNLLARSTEELTLSYERQLVALKSSNEETLSSTVLGYEEKIATLINEYEEKLSNTLIHSNSQNSRLDEELVRSRQENEQSNDRITALTVNLDNRLSELGTLTSRIEELQAEMRNEQEKSANLALEMEALKHNALLTTDEKISELNNQIFQLNQAHSEYVGELQLQVDNLSSELQNVTSLFESSTNALGASELSLEQRNEQLVRAEAMTISLQNLLTIKENEFEIVKLELQSDFDALIASKEVEFQKLLVENTNIISEIEDAYTKIETLEAEHELLKAEVEEGKTRSSARVEELKETLNAKNYEITNLEANNAALGQEIILLKREILALQENMQNAQSAEGELNSLKQNFELADSEKQHLLTELCALQETVASLNSEITALNEKNAGYENEIEALKADTKAADQEIFIGRLYKEIESLSEQRLALLDEKEQMAGQLIRMNEVVGTISQQIETERIDVTSLNNHRKNVILATNSEENEGNSSMKKQINELVREIDKCIALLSA
jgi:chromosome segregation ATPase